MSVCAASVWVLCHVLPCTAYCAATLRPVRGGGGAPPPPRPPAGPSPPSLSLSTCLSRLESVACGESVSRARWALSLLASASAHTTCQGLGNPRSSTSSATASHCSRRPAPSAAPLKSWCVPLRARHTLFRVPRAAASAGHGHGQVARPTPPCACERMAWRVPPRRGAHANCARAGRAVPLHVLSAVRIPAHAMLADAGTLARTAVLLQDSRNERPAGKAGVCRVMGRRWLESVR